MGRTKLPDVKLHVSYQNVYDGIPGDPKNCTFGRCTDARDRGMGFFVNVDPLKPEVIAEWIERNDNGEIEHHRGLVEPSQPAQTIIVATDKAKRQLLRRFPDKGMDFLVTNHTETAERHRLRRPGLRDAVPGETDEAREERLCLRYERQAEIDALRERGEMPPAVERKRPIKARFQ